MAEIKGNIKKLKTGEIIGNIAILLSVAVIIAFIVMFSVARVNGYEQLQLTSLSVCPAILIISVAVSAVCNLKFGGAIDLAVRRYVLDTLAENAPLLKAEKQSLSFTADYGENTVGLQTNKDKEIIRFDFSALGRLSFSRRSQILEEIYSRLCKTFCKLYDRGTKYTLVSYQEKTEKKTGKLKYIIKDGKPDAKAYKLYLKNE